MVCSTSECQDNLVDQVLGLFGDVTVPIGLMNIFVGALFCFLGLRLFKCILFLIGFGVSFLASTFIFFAATHSPGVAIVLGLLAGIGGGFVMLYCRYVVYFVMGVSFGGCISLAVNLFFVLPNANASSAGNSVIATTIILGLLGGILGVWLGDLIVIICTAVSGSLQLTFGTFLISVVSFLQNSNNISAFLGSLAIEFILFIVLGIWFQNSKKEQWKVHYVQNNTVVNNNVSNSNSVSINLSQPQPQPQPQQYPGMMYPQQTATPFMQNPYAQQQPVQQGIQMDPMSGGSEYSQPQQYGYPQQQNEVPQFAKPQAVNVSL